MMQDRDDKIRSIEDLRELLKEAGLSEVPVFCSVEEVRDYLLKLEGIRHERCNRDIPEKEQ